MSSDIYAKPDLSNKVRYTRKTEDDRAEWQETDVCIYEAAEDIEDNHTFSQPQEEGQPIQNHPAVKKQAVRGATLCKGVLCVVVLAAIIASCIYFTVGLNKLNCSNSQQLQELLANNSQIQRSQNQLSSEVKQLKNWIEVNNTQLQSSYEVLSKNYSLLKEEVKQLKETLKGKWCPEGWMRFGCSCYYKFTEYQTWTKSKTACEQRGAHLVVIDSEEEQKFVEDLNRDGESWIGLTGTSEWNAEQQIYEWKWVDGSPLTKIFWETGSSYLQYDWGYAAYCSGQGTWKHSYKSEYRNWICEK